MLVVCYPIVIRIDKAGLTSIALSDGAKPSQEAFTLDRYIVEGGDLYEIAKSHVSKHFVVDKSWVECIRQSMWQENNIIHAVYVFSLPWNVKQRSDSNLKFASHTEVAEKCSLEDKAILNRM